MFRWSTFRSAIAIALVLLALATLAPERSARAQACCASAGLIAPTRLRSYEDVAVGVLGRGRSVVGAFGAGGGYTGNEGGSSEWDFEQDLFAVARVLTRGQVALTVPFVETHMAGSGFDATGGGVGDVAVSARYDFVAAGERPIVPGLALLLGLVLPTGKAADDPSAGVAGATGQGGTMGSVGIGVEQAFEPYFVTLSVLLGLRAPRDVLGIHESFAPMWTGVLAAGRVLRHGITIGVYASVLRQGANSNDGGTIQGSDQLLLTGGLAGAVPLSDYWRVQGTAFGDLPVGGLGRNHTAGVGGTLSIMRLWL